MFATTGDSSIHDFTGGGTNVFRFTAGIVLPFGRR
jgi:hypothetical protein